MWGWWSWRILGPWWWWWWGEDRCGGLWRCWTEDLARQRFWWCRWVQDDRRECARLQYLNRVVRGWLGELCAGRVYDLITRKRSNNRSMAPVAQREPWITIGHMPLVLRLERHRHEPLGNSEMPVSKLLRCFPVTEYVVCPAS